MTLFFMLRLPSIIEPYWYGDEGIYQVIGQEMHQGKDLYKDIWDNKPPLLYVIYALANGDQSVIRFVSLLFGVASVPFLYILSRKLFPFRIALATTGLYVFLFGSPILEGNIANAENFMQLPILGAAILIYTYITKTAEHHRQQSFTKYLFLHNKFLIAGLLLGIAFLFKIVAVFDLAAFVLFYAYLHLTKLSFKQIKGIVVQLLPLFLGFVFPIFLTFLYFASQGLLQPFMESAFVGNVDYVEYQNYLFGIPQGLLILKVILLAAALFFVYRKRQKFSLTALFVTLWMICAVFSAFFSGRQYMHYTLVMLPSFCLIFGLILQIRKPSRRYTYVGILAVICVLFHLYFVTWAPKVIGYYQNVTEFLTGQRSLKAYQEFFDVKVPRDYAVAAFIKANTKPDDQVFIWGNNPQIYVLANKLPPSRYAVAYHVKDNPIALEATQKELDKVKPKYIIVLGESEPLPFRAPLYIMLFNLDGATIYERSF